ncbi:hypothetical protein BN946_scf185008.g30 [Trametes cinnabarina]|uniref:C2H2-type domain-containing protein n=1 Tax=Pycnoporus cinnabarinus TaxID=5643 RepID=A0A060SLF5_PYCCI|nr:hypothetical protein BN946_scf185008.g30 [Trametes cinnabarina]
MASISTSTSTPLPKPWLPPELIEKILNDLWSRPQRPRQRAALFKTICRVNHMWLGLFLRVALRHVHIPCPLFARDFLRLLPERAASQGAGDLFTEEATALVNKLCRSLTFYVDGSASPSTGSGAGHTATRSESAIKLFSQTDAAPTAISTVLYMVSTFEYLPGLRHVSIEYTDWGYDDLFDQLRLAIFPSQVTHLSLKYSFSAPALVPLAVYLKSLYTRHRQPHFSMPTVRYLSMSGVPTEFVADMLLVCPEVETVEIASPARLYVVAPMPQSVHTLVFVVPGRTLDREQMHWWMLNAALEGKLFHPSTKAISALLNMTFEKAVLERNLYANLPGVVSGDEEPIGTQPSMATMAHPNLSPSSPAPSRAPSKAHAFSPRSIHAPSSPSRAFGSSSEHPSSSYEHLSALRSTHVIEQPSMFQPVFTGVDECGCAPQVVLPSLDCEECAQECDSSSCSVELTEQCTEKCVVVACNDAHHVPLNCEENLPASTYSKECFGEADCAVFDELFRCCDEFHPGQADYRAYASEFNQAAAYSGHFVADPAFEAYFGGPFHAHGLPSREFTHIQPLDSTAPTPQLIPSPAFDPSPSPLVSQESSHNVSSPASPSLPSPAVQTQAPNLLQCKWAGCLATFRSLPDLVGHVNVQHLRLSSPPSPSQNATASPYLTMSGSHGASQQVSDVACLWEDCQLYPSPQSVPGPSSGKYYDVLDFLASHLLQDHLGLPPQSLPQSSFHHGPSPLSQMYSSGPSTSGSTVTPDGAPPTPVAEHDCSAPSAHVCKWADCGQSFSSCDTLTEHIASVHIGSGRAHYDCFWSGCTRNGESGFASKQKISRHMQSHTGHRPFQCDVCKQNFSEAATLAQHMRRHTQEKPYVCDFPGCGKAFAIAGALTIHKRTHNGSKPFKCTYCDRAFSESSNLSKHVSTFSSIVDGTT